MKINNSFKSEINNLKQIYSINAHDSYIKQISIFPSGNLISVSNDYSIKIFNDKFEILQIIKNAHDDIIYDVDIKDEYNFITCSTYIIKIWFKKEIKVTKYILKQVINNAHYNIISKIIFNSNGNIISCSYDKSVKIWEENNINKYQCITILKHISWVYSILILEDLNILISSGSNGTKFWNINNYEFITFIENAFCYNNNSLKRIDKERIIVGGCDGLIKIISISKKIIIKEIINEFWCHSICSIQNKNIFLIGGNGNDIKIYRNDNYECIQTIEYAHEGHIYGIILLKDGTIASFFKEVIKIWSF